jgi:RNA polymerase sigma-70 factor (ECF subfamily)
LAIATATMDPPVPTPEPAGPDTVAAEAELLRRADAARKAGDASLALNLLDEHRARFPTGILVQEREAERVVVLCALGRSGDARAAAAAFLRDWPHSPLAGRVRSSCGGS